MAGHRWVRWNGVEAERAAVRTRLAWLRSFAGYAEGELGSGRGEALAAAVEQVADTAERLLQEGADDLSGDLVEQVWSTLASADFALIEALPDDLLNGWAPEIVATVHAILSPDDPRRVAMDRRWSSAPGTVSADVSAAVAHVGLAVTHVNTAATLVGDAGGPAATGAGALAPEQTHLVAANALVDQARAAVRSSLASASASASATPRDRVLLSSALQAAYELGDQARAAVRRLRRTLLLAAGTVSVLLALVTVIGVLRPGVVSLCVTVAPSTTAACPSGGSPAGRWDLPLVELFGMIGAALAAARSLSGLGTAVGHYSLPAAQAVLKGSFGSATALLGVLFLTANIIPNLGGVTSGAGILAYAVVFGYAQQLLTGLIDSRATGLLSDAPPAGPARSQGAT